MAHEHFSILRSRLPKFNRNGIDYIIKKTCINNIYKIKGAVSVFRAWSREDELRSRNKNPHTLSFCTRVNGNFITTF
jgi:hypothetical protein